MAIDHYRVAIEALQHGKFQIAINHLNLAIMNNSSHAEAFHNRGACKQKMGDIEGAIHDFDKAIEKGFGLPIAFHNRGVAKLDLGRYETAVDDFDQVIALDPNHRYAFYNRGTAKIHLEDFAGAISDFDKAISLEPINAEAFRNRGVAKFKLENLSAAIADLDKAISLDPKQAEYFLCRSAIHTKVGNLDAAVSNHNQAIKLNPSAIDLSSPDKKVVFKYYDVQYEGDWKEGKIRVSARDPLKEQYEAGEISDPTEGTTEYHIDNLDSQNDDQMSKVAELGLASSPEYPSSDADPLGGIRLFHTEGGSVSMSNVTLKPHMENTHIFCTAMKRDDARWAQIPCEQGGPYNAVLKILDIHEFCKRVYFALNHDVLLRRVEISECNYIGNRKQFPNVPSLSHFLKPPDLAWQHEKKAIFFARDNSQNLIPEFVYIKTDDLIEFLKFEK